MNDTKPARRLVYACEQCGCTRVQVAAWIDVNRMTRTEGDGPIDAQHCPRCDEDVPLTMFSCIDPVQLRALGFPDDDEPGEACAPFAWTHDAPAPGRQGRVGPFWSFRAAYRDACLRLGWRLHLTELRAWARLNAQLGTRGTA